METLLCDAMPSSRHIIADDDEADESRNEGVDGRSVELPGLKLETSDDLGILFASSSLYSAISSYNADADRISSYNADGADRGPWVL
mmetsp:Transcript_134499/g.251657  ORF Transcript_134499/g.251657 Transcript_134499/m.251657 type:complete len:87 (+) Transcript_134499:381-641(+)